MVQGIFMYSLSTEHKADEIENVECNEKDIIDTVDVKKKKKTFSQNDQNAYK